MPVSGSSLDGENNSELTDSVIHLLHHFGSHANVCSAIGEHLKSRYGEVFVDIKLYDSDVLQTINGMVVEVDKDKKYIALRTKGGEKEYLHFVGGLHAIYAIRNANGKELYKNTAALLADNLVMMDEGRAKSLLEEGVLNNELVPTKLALASTFQVPAYPLLVEYKGTSKPVESSSTLLEKSA
jgi:hypothetical protein